MNEISSAPVETHAPAISMPPTISRAEARRILRAIRKRNGTRAGEQVVIQLEDGSEGVLTPSLIRELWSEVASDVG